MKGIYKITNNLNNKVYIGQSINIENRFGQYKRNYTNPNEKMYTSKIYRAFRKYGIENFSFEVLEESDYFTKEELDQKEINYIALFKSQEDEFGYNIARGGADSAIPRKLTKENILVIKNLLLNSNIRLAEIANMYNVSDSLIYGINAGRIWSFIGDFSYPIREIAILQNVGGKNPSAKFSDEEVMEIRKKFVKRELNSIYEEYKDRISFSEIKKICYGCAFAHLPIYKKRKKQWILNGKPVTTISAQESTEAIDTLWETGFLNK